MDSAILMTITLEELHQAVRYEVTNTLREFNFNTDKDAAFVSIKKAAELIGVSRPTLYEMIKADVITKYRINGIPRIKVSELIDAAKISS